MSDGVGGRPSSALVRATGVCAAVAAVLAVVLPLAPVRVNEPTVSWPADPARPASTLLHLASYRPLELDVRFSCRAARAAAQVDTPATVISTVSPVLPEVGQLGLVARVGGQRLVVDAVGRRLVDEPLPRGDCRYRVHGHPGTGLVVSRDGTELARGPAGALPDVDLLVTSLAALPGGSRADLGVVLRVDDEFASSPTGLKTALTLLLGFALVGVVVGLWRLDRAVPRVPRMWRLPRPHPVDAAVVAALLGWLLLAPSTDDDGYYAAMATNARHTGFVGNYYQLYDQSFTPITWFYRLLGGWQGLVGTAPVAQRLPALAVGLLTWWVLRALVSSALRGAGPAGGRPPMRRVAPVVAAAGFLAWWLPQDMGVRPEGVVALLSLLALLGVWVAVRRRRLVAAWAACAAAGLALATHTTGFVGLAPLLAGAGGLSALVRVPGSGARTAARAAAVVSGATTAALAGFADGSLRDFLRAQQIFLDIQHREYWYTEYLRWFFLLGDGPMGNYAKRVAVLVAVLGLVWFLLLAAAGRARGEPLPLALRLAGWTLLVSFGLLWLTPSKWTHHFGALAGVGPLFLTLFLVWMVPLVRRVLGGQRVPPAVLAASAGSVLIAFTLAGRGPDAWPYAWMYGFPDPNSAPGAGPIALRSPLMWALLLAGCVVAGWLWARRGGSGGGAGGGGGGRIAGGGGAGGGGAGGGRSRDGADQRGSAVLRGVAVFVVAGLTLNVGYLLGSFTLAARNTFASWSLWAADATDPGGRRCGATDAISVFDPFAARPLPEAYRSAPNSRGRPRAPEPDVGVPSPARATTAPAPGAGRDGESDAESTGFERAGGYYLGNQPPVRLGTGAASAVWGSLFASADLPPDRTTGEMRTPWYRLPGGLPPERALAVLVAGSPSRGNSLTAEYADLDAPTRDGGALGGDTPARDGEARDGEVLDDGGRDPRWRSIQLHPPAGAELVRLHAVDISAGPGGWLAFAAPAVQDLVPLRAVLDRWTPAHGPVALAWQIAFQYPCLRQPVIRHGISEPSGAALLWAPAPFTGILDPTWQSFRGGLHGSVQRSQSMLQLTAVVRGAPAERRLEVLLLDSHLARDAYLLRTAQRRTGGLTQGPPTPTRTLNDLERCVQRAAATRTSPAGCQPEPIR